MTDAEKWKGYNNWREKEEAIKKIGARHIDLANLIRLKNWVYSMKDNLENTIGDMAEDEESKTIRIYKEDLTDDYSTLELVVKQLKRDVDALAKEYGEEEAVCHL